VSWPASEAVSRTAAVVLLTLVVVMAYLLVVDVASASFIERVTRR
jgi:preprotein translocase subunit SecE